MSWSINFIGKPENVVKALEDFSPKLTGQSKEEYDDALPHLVGLVKQNFGESTGTMLKISASGSGFTNGEQKQRSLSCHIEFLYGVIV